MIYILNSARDCLVLLRFSLLLTPHSPRPALQYFFYSSFFLIAFSHLVPLAGDVQRSPHVYTLERSMRNIK